MSSRRSVERESRSYYSRSSSCENNRSNSSYRHRPLSSLLTERDFSSPSHALDRFDDPFFFDRPPRKFFDDFDRPLRSRFNDDIFSDEFFGNNSLNFGRNVPINNYSSSSITRNIPVQYTTSSSSNQREKVYKKMENVDNWSSNSFDNRSFQTGENRISANDWPRKQESPTRKRTSMTIHVRQPRVQYSDVPNYQRPASTSGYSTTYRTNY